MTEFKVIKIQVNGKIAVSPIDEIVCGNDDYAIEFLFTEEWQKHNLKTARFIWTDKPVDVIFSGNVCLVPRITGTKLVEVGVFAGDLSTTSSAFIKCRKSILCKNGIPKPPATDVYNQLIQMVDETRQIAQSVRDDADAGKFNGKPGPTGEPGPKGEPGYVPQKGIDYLTPTDIEDAKTYINSYIDEVILGGAW